MSKREQNITKLDESIKGKGINDLAHDIDLSKENMDFEFSQDLIDNRNYDKYDYYEFDRKKGTVKNYIIMFALYAIVVAIVILLIIGIKYKEKPSEESVNGEVETNETQN